MKFVATAALVLTVVTLPIIGGVLVALVAFGAFLLALVGVLAGLDDRTVRQHDVVLDGRRWRGGA
jgi:hypothetical protein